MSDEINELPEPTKPPREVVEYAESLTPNPDEKTEEAPSEEEVAEFERHIELSGNEESIEELLGKAGYGKLGAFENEMQDLAERYKKELYDILMRNALKQVMKK